MTTNAQLPAYGWTGHSEQTDVAALEQRVWHMKTKMLWDGLIVTAILQTPDDETIRKLEAINAAAKQQGSQCTIHQNIAAMMDANGCFNRAVQVFWTTAFDGHGQPLKALQAVATTPEEARKNHFGAVALLAGALATWDLKDQPA